MTKTGIVSAQLTKHAFLIRDYDRSLIFIRVCANTDDSALFAFHINEDRDFRRVESMEELSCSIDNRFVLPALLAGLWWLWRNEIFTGSHSKTRKTMMSAARLLR